MYIDVEKLIKGYHETIKDKYPDLTLDELTVMCKAPFKFLKQSWKNLLLPTIRFMYFGTFVVYKGRNAFIDRSLDRGLSMGTMTQERIEKLKQIQINQNRKDE